jgi:hypothetical protein
MNTIASPTHVERVSDYRASLDGARHGRLVFDSGTADLRLSGDPTQTDLLRARFARKIPRIAAGGGEVVVSYPGVVPVFGWIRSALRLPRARIVLNTSIPWELEFRRGVTRLDADLREIDVRSVAIDSGISRALLRLGHPRGPSGCA